MLGRIAGGLASALVAAVAPVLPAQAASSYEQVTADPPIAVPATQSCSEQVVVHDFANSYYAPALGTLMPPSACPAPWSTVVVSFSASVGGVQFDRLADVYVGAVDVFSTSTSEPCCTPGATVFWTWQKDVTEYLPLFTQPQPVTVFLNNVNDSTYTGVYHVTVSFTFYETGVRAPAGSHPDTIVPVDDYSTDFRQSGGGDGFFTLTSAGQLGSAAVTLPRNLLRLQAELYAQGHGPCEEFWWGDPNDCGVSTPYREVDVYLDGQLAGAAAVYPVIFTGADGPGLWEPIPSPRAWNLRPLTVDLTPFVGRLVDGAPHTVSLGISDVVYGSGDYWLVGANLLGWTDPLAAQTSGTLTGVDAPPAPSETNTEDPTGTGIVDLFSEQHALHWSGAVTGSAGTVATSVSEGTSTSGDEAGVSVDNRWEWTTSVTDPSGTLSTDDVYTVVDSSPGHFTLGDSGSTTAPGGASSSYAETMTTAAVGLALNGAECESYAATFPGGAGYARTLVAAAGEVVADEPFAACSTQPSPASSVPESPLTLLLVAAAGVPTLVMSRRLRRSPRPLTTPDGSGPAPPTRGSRRRALATGGRAAPAPSAGAASTGSSPP
jgi:hypothetical protein